MRILLSLFLVLGLMACNSTNSTEVNEPSAAVDEGAEQTAAGPTPTAVNEDGSRLFGAALSEGGETLSLQDVMDRASELDGTVVKTEGHIAQVCQRMGCWMELRPAADSESGIRVPMAGHSFFLPRDVAGSRALIEGELSVEELPEETQQHLREEGAEFAAVTIQIEATGVVVQ